VFGKKKKPWFTKFFGIKLKILFSKRVFSKKHDKKMGYQTDLYPLKKKNLFVV
jgi:hypothetical protein